MANSSTQPGCRRPRRSDVAPGVELGGGVAEEAGQRGGAHPGAAVRLLERLQEREPLDGGGGGEHAAAAGDDRGHADLAQRLAHGGEVGVAVADHRDVAGPDRLAAPGRPRGEEPAYVERQVARDVRSHLADRERAAAAAPEGLAPHDAQPERVGHRGALQARGGVMGGDVVHDDAVVPQGGAGQQGLQRVEERRIAAAVDREGLADPGGLGGPEVGGDVAAAEGVDRLLGVADQHHRGVAGEGPVEHVPLHRVGVLELVDEHDLPARPHPLGGGAVRLVEGVGELGEQVVVGEDPESALAPVELLADRAREADLAPRDRRAVLVGRLEPGLGVADRRPGDRHRLLMGERRLGVGERPQVEVVDGLLDEVVEVLDQPCSRVAVAGDAQRVEHHRAELVGGRDRRRVEAGERLGDPAVPAPPIVGAPGAQQRDQVGVAHPAGRRVLRQHALGLHELGAHPLAQLLAGRAAERHDEHLLEPGDPLGHVPRHERADRPGLAGAGAGLEQHGAGGQRVGDRERRHNGPTLSAPDSSGSQIAQAAAPSPASTRASTGAPAP